MKKYIIIYIAFVIGNSGYSQCNDFKYTDFGKSKYQIINHLNSEENVEDIEVSRPYWDDFDYLQDSVLISEVFFTYINHPCFKEDTRVRLRFENNKLYFVEYSIEFPVEEYQKGKDLYRSVKWDLYFMSNAENGKFQFVVPYEKYTGKGIEEEKIGEGISLYKNEKAKNEYKRYKISADFGFRFEEKWNRGTSEMERTGKIDSYLFEMTYYDLTVTDKLDIRGY